MSAPSPYQPDRSLLLATLILLGGSLLGAAGLYLLTGVPGATGGQNHTSLTVQSGTPSPPSTASPSASSARAFESSRRTPVPSPLFSVPSPRTGSDKVAPSFSPSGKTYALRPDMSHAEFGSPSGGSDPGRSNSGTARAGTGSPSDRGPDAGSAPQGIDLGTRSSSASSGAGAEWRSEASELGRQARALSGALAHLDRSGRSADEPPRSDGSSSAPDGDASTAATDRGSRAASDPPDPPPPPPQVPVDGGLGWLAAAGAAYAANRLRKKADEEGHADA